MSNVGPEPIRDANTLALMHAFNQAVAEAESAIALTEHVKDPAVASLHARLKNSLTLVKHSMTQSGLLPS
ncbi:hypothetical protein LG204_01285 [Methylovorus menthalis]|uniref:hypothetical protein n=1 Tax=Methylovorus menthalis TaxID=1002227 RepID=UPI001E617B2A|nr:hypothetical protein [Methylovorus menthalis]MCB4809947.1 hypothetical protein [Methylovorus menthalis]